ncbi:MAG: P-type conjugative transfer protein TrbL, partial [Reyranella sp.]|nr:P-type conjugative transfer protein TrbL [Reyranella sp.]
GASAVAGATRGSAALAGGATAAYHGGGLSGVTVSGMSGAVGPLRRAGSSLASNFDAGGRAAVGDAAEAGEAPAPRDAPPAWARRMRRSQAASHGASATAHAVRSGDHGGGGSSVDLSEGNR